MAKRTPRSKQQADPPELTDVESSVRRTPKLSRLENAAEGILEPAPTEKSETERALERATKSDDAAGR